MTVKSDRYAKLLSVIQAYAKGKTIQRTRQGTEVWETPLDSEVDFNDDRFEWRINPGIATITAWLNIYKPTCNSPLGYAADLHQSVELAYEAAGPNRQACIKIEFYEGQGL